MKKLFEKYKEQIEIIIANDDTIAIGAVKALQEHGYNNGDISKTIPIVGVYVIPIVKLIFKVIKFKSKRVL